MSDRTQANGFSEHHQRHVRTTFQYIDKLLSEAEHIMTDAGSLSPFRRHSDDTTPIQRKVTHDYILRIREAMRRVMEELQIPPSEPHSGAVWAAGINMMYSSISLNELTPERMRAYGPLSSEAADRLDGIRAELDGLVAKLRSYLGKGAGGDLQQRLQQLGKTGDEIRLLSEIERIVTAHGLVEFRGTLSMLLDRMESAAFEVGVFGRVSSGKSSLLNYILQTDVLPIGVTPVTAIPTRISHGPVAEAGIEFAEAQPQIIPLSELAEFATEQKNPSNKKHVTRIFVKLPSERLAEGVTFVDTPGLGSLAVAGAEETIAYLPRCDLGIVLIDASAGLTPDDLIVVQALYQAGASAMILISKADLFSAPDRERMVAYVKVNLRSELRIEPSVHAVSISGADAALCDAWFESELRPFLAQHHELAITSQKRKIGALRESVVGALERRLQVGSEAVSGESAMLPEKATEALRNGDRILERAQGESFFLTRKIAKMHREIIDIAAERIAAALTESEEVDAASIFSNTVTSLIAEPVAATLRSIEQTRSALGEVMKLAASVSGREVPDELPKPAGMPMIDVNEISQKIVIEKPGVFSLLGRGMLTSHVQRKLEAKYERTLLEFLSLYANSLRRWMEQSINALRNGFTEFADMHRAHFEVAPAPGLPDMSAFQSDLRVLREWENVEDASAISSTQVS
ncbi:MAG TPA: dynamin family protein [Candidatus Binatia bacterium]|nr:dynamin family protein [Candidatus Binatia bacterium]